MERNIALCLDDTLLNNYFISPVSLDLMHLLRLLLDLMSALPLLLINPLIVDADVLGFSESDCMWR